MPSINMEEMERVQKEYIAALAHIKRVEREELIKVLDGMKKQTTDDDDEPVYYDKMADMGVCKSCHNAVINAVINLIKQRN